RGRCLPYGDGVSFAALAEMARTQAGILATDSEEEAAAKLQAAVEALPGEADAGWLETHLRPRVGLAAEAPEAREDSFAAWRRFFEALAEAQPLVLVFEDLHWADPAVLDFVDHLVDWASGVPLLVLCTARPELLERRPGWGGGKLNALTISLSPLSDEETGLQGAAVVGKVFWLGAFPAGAGLERDEAERLLHQLERKEFVRRERRSSIADEGQLSFRHVLVRDVAYGQLPRPRRAEAHA